MTAPSIATALLAAIGCLWVLIAAIGVVLLPDLLTRMHAASKAATLGVACILVAVAVHFAETGIAMRVILICGFLFLTAPVAAHVIGRAGYFSGIDLSPDTVIDELRDDYEAKLAARQDDSGATPPPGVEGDQAGGP